MSELCISALGMVSALGHDVASSCAAGRARLSRAGELKVVGQPFGSLTMDGPPPNFGHQVPGIGAGFSGVGKILALALPALRDLLSARPIDPREHGRTGLLLSVSDHAVIDAHDARVAEIVGAKRPAPSGAWRERTRALAEQVAARAELGLAPQNLAVAAEGGPGFARALEEAAARIARGAIDRCIVGAADSRIEPRFLTAAAGMALLRTNDRAAGLIGGEAAAFALVERERDVRASRDRPLASVASVALGAEPTSHFDDAPAQGRCLASAVTGAVSSSATLASSLGFVVADLNGTERRAYEWGMAITRLRAAGLNGGLPVWMPAASFGDVGAASGAVGLCVAVRAFVRGYAPAPGAIVWIHSETGASAAIGLEAAAD
jgi:3-oxoacyl-[acyl-carrier-protein] synthase-1